MYDFYLSVDIWISYLSAAKVPCWTPRTVDKTWQSALTVEKLPSMRTRRLCKPVNGRIVWGFLLVPPGSSQWEHTMCLFVIQVLFRLKSTDSLCYLLAATVWRLYFSSSPPTLFSSLPNRCTPDRRQLPSDTGPKTHNRIQIKRWICYNDTDSEIPTSNKAFPGENRTAAQVNTWLWSFLCTCSMLRRRSPVFFLFVLFCLFVCLFFVFLRSSFFPTGHLVRGGWFIIW